MPRRHPSLPRIWPSIWLVTDKRNDRVLEAALDRMPRGSGVIFRHYHLTKAERRARFVQLLSIARRRCHVVALSGDAAAAGRWGADAAYGAPRQLARGPAILRLVTAHSLREIAAARRARADAVVLSPAFATRSHPGSKVLGPVRFRLLAARAQVPVIALGGMDEPRARRLNAAHWAAIDSLCGESKRPNSDDC